MCKMFFFRHEIAEKLHHKQQYDSLLATKKLLHVTASGLCGPAYIGLSKLVAMKIIAFNVYSALDRI